MSVYYEILKVLFLVFIKIMGYFPPIFLECGIQYLAWAAAVATFVVGLLFLGLPSYTILLKGARERQITNVRW